VPDIATSALARLDAALQGRAVGPDDAAWDEARTAWNLAVDQRPAVVAEARSVDDVQQVVRFAAANGLRVAAQGTGHGAPAVPSLDGAVLLRTGALDAIAIDADARVARLGAGATWGPVAAAAGEAGLAGLAGTSPSVGVTGYTVGGGAGWLVRRHGLAAWTLRAAEVVTAGGDVLRVDDAEHADLLWVLRGGGAAVVVTALEVDLVALPEAYAGGLWWPVERAPDVLAAWAAALPELPTEVTSIGRLLNVPDLPMLPEPVRGRSFVVVEAAVAGDATLADALLRPLRALSPAMDTFAAMGPAGLGAVHGDPPAPVPGAGGGALLHELPPAALEAMVAAAGAGSGTALIGVEVRHLGGAVADGAGVPAVLDRIAEPFASFAVGLAADPASRAATEASLADVAEAFAPWTSTRTLPTLADAPIDPVAAYGDAAARLRDVERTYDPDGLIVVNRRG